MITLNGYASGFEGYNSSVSGKAPRLCNWVWRQADYDGISVFVDGDMWHEDVDQFKSKIKVGWLHEAKELHPENYVKAYELRHKFDCILTYDEELIKSDPDKFRYTIRGGITIPREDWGIYHKTKNVAMLVSDKVQLEGHQLRHEIVKRIKGVDYFGKGINRPIENKLELKQYRYVIVVEATVEKNWFTEHLLDVIAMGCVPILYYPPEMIGTFALDVFLSIEGMALFKTLQQLRELVEVSNDGVQGMFVYERLLPHLYTNLMRLSDYETPEDFFINRIIPDLVEKCR